MKPAQKIGERHYNCGYCGCSHHTLIDATDCCQGKGMGFIVKIKDGKILHEKDRAEDYCGHERPARKVLCQLKHPHVGSHRAIIYWEDE